MKPILISVVIVSQHPWPALQEITEAALLQTRACGGEVILCVPSEECLPPEERHNDTIVVILPDADILTLYAAGMGSAQGEIIAVLEDHNMIQPDWCRRHIDAYRNNPSAQTVACAVINGTASTLVDRANFLYGFSAYHPNAAPEVNCRIPTVAGSSIRRSFIRDFPPKPGYVETALYWEAYSAGVSFFDRENVVVHYQHRALLPMLSNHFHNGKANAGYCRRYYTAKQWIFRFAAAIAAPWLALVRWGTGNNRKNLANSGNTDAIPMLVLIQAANSAGCVCGLLFGVGSSGSRT